MTTSKESIQMVTIRATDLSFHYTRGQNVFRDLNWEVRGPSRDGRGHITAVMGRSGTGKTTLLRLAAGIERPTSGAIVLDPKEAPVAYVEQEPVLFEHLSREENARYFALVRGTRARFQEDVYQEALDRLQLREALISEASVAKMSGGERQRLSLLRALSVRPRILLLDEPCTGLDVDVKGEFLRMLREVVDRYALLALYVTHHWEEASMVADEVMFLEENLVGVVGSLASRPIGQAIERPINVEMASVIVGPNASIVECEIGDDGTLIASGRGVLGKRLASKIPAGRYIVIVPPESVLWDATNGESIVIVGESDRWFFARSSSGDRVSGPRVDRRPISFGVCGTILALPHGGGLGWRLDVAASESESRFEVPSR